VPSSAWLHDWLHPITEGADAIVAANVPAAAETAPLGGGEALWAGIAFVLATAIIVVTARLLVRRLYRPAAESPVPAGLGRVLYNKWYVDEIYDVIVVRPVVGLSRAAWRWIDQGLIDGIVNGAGYAARALGWVGSRMQTGQLNTYAFAVVAGAILLLAFVVL
jgi:NADH-quinone oxidoreductase subunit L